MPIYEYRCGACGSEQEALQKISDPPLTVCKVCQASSLQKMVSAPAFRLKGSGWYETDFKSGNKKNLAGDKPAGGGGEEKTKSAGGGDAKAPAKTESQGSTGASKSD